MRKTNDLSALIDSLIRCGETLAETGRALKEYYSESDGTPEKTADAEKREDTTPAPEPDRKQYSKEEVRGILAKKANEADGRFKAEIKAIVQKYGNGGSLTDVDSKDYASMIAEVEGLADA